MIERTEVDGRAATVCYLMAGFTPTDPASAELIKLIFDDGEIVFLEGRARAKDYNPYHEPGGTPEGGRFARGPGGGSGEPETYERGGGGGPSKSKLAEVRLASQRAVDEGARLSPNKPLKGSESKHPATIASRIATGAKADKTVYRQPSLEAMRERAKPGEDKFSEAVALLDDPLGYPNLRPDQTKGDPLKVARNLIDHAKSNLRFLYNAAPARIREESKLWYDGARLIATETAKTYKLNDAAVVGVYAALSPQKLWDQNVYLAQELVRIHQTQRDFAWDEKMDATAERIWMPKNPDSPTANDMKRQSLVQEVMGKKLGELTDPVHKAMWIRTYSEAHTDRHYKLVKPTGEFGEFSVNKDGTKSTAAWQALPMMVNAINALESEGDRDKISDAMGDEHKVRSFYNNILDPASTNQDVTMDTHAFGAALLRPLSGSTTAVMHGLGTSPQPGKAPPNWEGVPKSAVTGNRGLYGLYATAYRELAHDLGIEPRQLQSITWEAKRELFDDSMKDAAKRAVDAAWVDYRDGKATLEETQKAVFAAGKRLEE